MRASLFHRVVAASCTAILTIGLTAPASAQEPTPGQSPFTIPGEPPLRDAPSPFPAPPGVLPDDGLPDLPARPPTEAMAADPTAAPTSREDLDTLFAELRAPRPEGDESWRRAESDILRAWSRSGSASVDLLRQRGVSALDAGEIETAIGHLTALTDHAPDYATGYVDRAAAYATSGNYGPAAADLRRALSLEPRNFIALTLLGAMLSDMGDEARALQAFEASLAIHPHQPEASDAVEALRQTLQGTPL